ncbi:MAG: EAL domain-containing protein [Pseudolabrys sp.]
MRTFPFQKIKIDQSFIRGLGEERDAQAIIGAVSDLGASLDKIVVAEGIEKKRTAATKGRVICSASLCPPKLSGRAWRPRRRSS